MIDTPLLRNAIGVDAAASQADLSARLHEIGLLSSVPLNKLGSKHNLNTEKASLSILDSSRRRGSCCLSHAERARRIYDQCKRSYRVSPLMQSSV